MLRTGAFIGKTGVLTPGQRNSGISVNWARKLKAIRDQSTVDCCDPVTIPHCDPPRERCMMDLLPVPCGPWQDYYDKENAKNTKFLIYSTAVFIFTCFCFPRTSRIIITVMAVLHRALFTWFNLLIFLILLVLRLDQRIQWNWFIVFIPMWLYDNILLTYVVFNMISHCKNGHDRINTLRRKGWYVLAVLLKFSAQILICLKLETPHWNLPAKAILAPVWFLLPALGIDVFIHLIQHSRY